MELVFITGNAHKYEEASSLFSRMGIDLEQADLGYPEVQADNLEEVAEYGIAWCEEKLKKPCFIEDAGMFIDVLNGFPGPYSKYVFQRIGNQGILKLLDNETNRKAIFRSVIAFQDGLSTRLFIGETEGRIAHEGAGSGGFGYDPIFIPAENDRTFAQMGIDEKNELSHRGKSLYKLVNYFKERK